MIRRGFVADAIVEIRHFPRSSRLIPPEGAQWTMRL
jgi:hypothetical protein